MKTGRYNFQELLTHNEIDQIIIPEIQRDYVWKEDNVLNLINDIVRKFREKKEVSLDISVNQSEVDNNVKDFLQKEYEKLRYHLKLGFIYAYYDREFPGKFFLIDGQQRITTLYLMLLYLTTKQKADDKNRLKKLYFTEGNLKIDYKVREESHDFMELLIRSELNGEYYINQKDYYKTTYENDITVKHLIASYKVIKEQLGKIDDKKKLLEFLEEFVEFNYFDTNLSEQGEQLYIYMNSRGEDLSFQEGVRADFIKKTEGSDNKKEFAKKWETWQNFFWRYRGNNENADIGFEEFLKWVVIIDIWEKKSKELAPLYIEKGGTLKDIQNQYINEKIKASPHKEKYRQYLKNYVSPESLEKAFDALEILKEKKEEIASKYISFESKFLQGELDTINYLIIIPLLVYLKDIPSKEIQIKELERRTMFFKNKTFYENIAKNPADHLFQLTTLINNSKGEEFIQFINTGINDITENEKNKFGIFNKKEDAELEEWETFFWDITLDKDINPFLMGDTEVIIQNSTNNNLESFKETKKLIKNVFYNNRDKNELRALMFCHMDFPYEYGRSLGMPKYNILGETTSDSWSKNKRWKQVFENESFENFINWIRDNNTEDLETLFSKCNKSEIKDYRRIFIEYPDILDFCEKQNFVKSNEENQGNRIILLRSFRHTSDSAREIQCELLKVSFNKENEHTGRKMWCYQDHTCVFDFYYDEEKSTFYYEESSAKRDNQEGRYILDILYDYEKSEWGFNLWHSGKEGISKALNIEKMDNWYLNKDNRLLKKSENGEEDGFLYACNHEKSVLENNQEILIQVESLLNEIEGFIKTYRISEVEISDTAV